MRAITTDDLQGHLGTQAAMDPNTPVYVEVGGHEFPLSAVRVHFAEGRVCQVTLVGAMTRDVNIESIDALHGGAG